MHPNEPDNPSEPGTPTKPDSPKEPDSPKDLDTPNGCNTANDRAIWNDYNDRQTFEHELINRTTTWLLTSQGLLFAGYGVTFTAACAGSKCNDIEKFRDVVAHAGLLIAAIMFFGVFFLIISKLVSWQQYQGYFGAGGDLPGPLANNRLPWGVKTWNTILSVTTDLLLPLVFVFAWWCLIRSVA